MRIALFRLLVLSTLLLCSVGFSARADEVGPETDSTTPNPEPVITYAAGQRAEFVAVGTEDILLIQTNDPWERADHYVGANWYDGVTSDTRVLDSLGYSYRIATWADISSGAVDIFSYPVVLIVNDQVQAFYDNYATRVSDFESYVSSGHTLVFFAAGSGWAGGVLRAPLPGGVSWNFDYVLRDHVVDPTHPIPSATLSDSHPLLDADLYSNYCNHGWFSNLAANTRVILSENGQDTHPTLIEYRLGAGRVIASTLTWEHSWSYHTGSDGYGTYARKALDDVFLYAFSGGAIPATVTGRLRIDDALANVPVNKSRGSFMDVVALVSGDAAYDVSVVLQVPNDQLGSPVTSFTRNRPNNDGHGQDGQWTSQGQGRYKITTTLVAVGGQYQKEVVWRFRVPSTAPIQAGVQLSATMSIPDHTIDHPTFTGQFNVVDYARAIIITNRKLLFEKYQPNLDRNDVSGLLQAMFLQANAYHGEVFYIDLYDTAAESWNQTVDYTSETSANVVASGIDGFLEQWYQRLTRTDWCIPFWCQKTPPEYLLIVGGDEVIPFYRADDRAYGDDEHCYLIDPDCCTRELGKPCFPTGIDNEDPTGRAPNEHVVLTDNIYANIGGQKNDWETGDLQLSTGRVLGASADAMRRLVESGGHGPTSLDNVVMASFAGGNLDTIRSRLNSKHVTTYGESDPDLTENSDWTRDQWITALSRDYDLVAYMAHGAFDAWVGTGEWSSGVKAGDHPAGGMATHHPLVPVFGCNLALPTDLNGASWQPAANDCMSYKLVDLGISGFFASTGIAWYNIGSTISYGERLENDYFKYLIDPSKGSSEHFGTAMLKAKQNYPANGSWGAKDNHDKKTLVEFVYYGLPWTWMPTPDHPALNVAPPALVSPGFDLGWNEPQPTGGGGFERTLTATVTSYQFSQVGNLELLQILGADDLYSSQKPILPALRATLVLPQDATISAVTLVGESSVSLGAHAIASADPANDYHPTSGYTASTDVTGPYPPDGRFGYEVRRFPDRTELRLTIMPATFDTVSHEVTLFNATQVRASFVVSDVVALKTLGTDQPLYDVGAPIHIRSEVENVGAEPTTVVPSYDIVDAMGNVVGSCGGQPLVLAAGQSATVPDTAVAPGVPGAYRLRATFQRDGVPVAGSSVGLEVQAGRIVDFISPPALRAGEYGSFEVTFANHRTDSIVAYQRIMVVNSSATEVASLLQKEVQSAAQATNSTTWTWEPGGLADGLYHVQAVVQVENEYYFSALHEMRVGQVNQAPTADAGLNVTAECTGNRSAPVQLDGSRSSDPDGDPLNYAWSAPGVTFDDATGVRPTGMFPLGVTVATLAVSDGEFTSTATVSITVGDTIPPSIVCPNPTTPECQSMLQSDVALQPATASDTCYGSAAITNTRTPNGSDASGSYPLGTTSVSFTATDGSGNTASCETAVTVVDTTPPVVTVNAAPNYLWPPNHKVYAVHNGVSVFEACDPSPSLILQSVVSSEPDDAPGGGDGNTFNDIQDASIGTPDFDILLRAERQGSGPGRSYTIQYQATDASGKVGLGTDTVRVPHDQDGIEEPISLTMDSPSGTVVNWERVYWAQHFDVIRGSLEQLRVDGSNLDLGSVVCLETNGTSNDTVGAEDTTIPEPGKAFFYLVQFYDGTKESGYGEPSALKARVPGAGSQPCH